MKGCTRLSAFTILLITAPICAREAPAQSQSRAGIRAGLVMSTFLMKNAEDFKEIGWIGGPSVTLYYQFSVGSGLSVQPELSFVRKGAFLSYLDQRPFLAVQRRVDLTLDYLELPLLLMVTVPDHGSTRGGIFLGPYVAVRAGFEVSDAGRGAPSPLEPLGTLSVEEDLSPLDAGGIIGGNIRVAAGTLELLFDARISLGATDVSRDGGDFVGNAALVLSAGIAC